MPPQRPGPAGAPAGPPPAGGPQVGPARGPYRSGDMPLLTHDETGAASVAREGRVALAERPGGRNGPPTVPPKGPKGTAGKKSPRRRI
ncbi:MAG TPA: hypothetical protein VGO89_03635, partial [Streptomyces sp.]|nr:hypothetical protein [Streptomyces sp.]